MTTESEAAFRARIVAEARRWIGTPYRHQASLIGVGCDCLGLVRGVWRGVLGVEPEAPPPYPRDFSDGEGADALIDAAGRHLSPVALAEIRPGDVLLFRWKPQLPARHCAILADGAAILHAHDGARVAEVPFAPFWRRRLAAAFAFRPPEPPTETP